MRISIKLISSVIACVVSSCSVGPDYVTPETEPAPSFIADIEGVSGSQLEVEWWKLFNDSQLDSLIERAVDGNKDLQVAVARVEESRQLLTEARFDYYPTIRSSAGYSVSRTSPESVGIPEGAPFDAERESFRAGFDATWEIDLFGYVRRFNEQREALLQSTEARLRDVLVTLIAEVGRTYVQLRGDQNRLSVARKNADNQSQTVKLTQARLEGGQATELDTSRARAQFSNTLALIPPLESAVESGVFRLSVLLGERPGALRAELIQPKAIPQLPQVISISDPKSLLQRRPDVRAAERNLAAAVAQVGVATAELYPRITFSGNFGYDAPSFRDFGSGTRAWNYGPALTWAAFDLGRVRAALAAADANADATLAEFEGIVLRALEETERSFVVYDAARRTRAHLADAANSSATAAELANIRYKDGVTDFITVLDAERTMLDAQDKLAQSSTEAATSLVAVYKALGGGWEAYISPQPVAEQVQSIFP